VSTVSIIPPHFVHRTVRLFRSIPCEPRLWAWRAFRSVPSEKFIKSFVLVSLLYQARTYFQNK
jgi:hypothetical protein